MKSQLQENYYDDGQVKSQYWYLNGLRHNENGPAYIWFYKNGQISSEGWCLYGLYHNENGPAYISHYQNGQIEYQEWHLKGIKYTEEEFKKYKLIKEMAGIK